MHLPIHYRNEAQFSILLHAPDADAKIPCDFSIVACALTLARRLLQDNPWCLSGVELPISGLNRTMGSDIPAVISSGKIHSWVMKNMNSNSEFRAVVSLVGRSEHPV